MKLIFYVRYRTKFGENISLHLHSAQWQEERQIALHYLNDAYWKAELDLTPAETVDPLFYFYTLEGTDGVRTYEHRPARQLHTNHLEKSVIKIYDTWSFAGTVAHTFATAPFREVLLPQHRSETMATPGGFTHVFKVKAPLLKEDEAICLIGERPELGSWNHTAAVRMKYDGQHWLAAMNLTGGLFPFAYKYGIYNKKEKSFLQFEEGDNRACLESAQADEQIILEDGFVNIPYNTWRGAGVSVPVFSLRSTESFGVGEFNDLKLLADWAAQTGLKMIQILPVNDTMATGSWTDSYPYAAISAFALHPLYIHLDAIEGKWSDEMQQTIQKKKEELNERAQVDYEAVISWKLKALRALYEINGADCFASNDYQNFFNTNHTWLQPYAVYSHLRDLYGSPVWEEWPQYREYVQEEIEAFFEPGSEAYEPVQFYCYVQYQLHLQLSDAVKYAHQKGVVLKGDIPIGVYRHGCDAWMAPELYHMEWQAGAPPDDFAVRGQNWGFPTYNWQRMQDDGFAWWRERFRQMSSYFDAFRIDHILGFFRIWSVPLHAVEGVMGRFQPCIPVQVSEFGEKGLWFDYERFCLPYITDDILQELFGQRAKEVAKTFLQKQGPFQYVLRPEFATQRQVEAYFKNKTEEDHTTLRNGLYNLISNVILFEEEGTDQKEFHFRISIDRTSSFRYLPDHVKEKLWELYIDYFYRRQNEFWRKESLQKLPHLKAATSMLICGEDLGMVPESVPGVMGELGILSLEIQRMPKQPGITFFQPATAPYLSVITPSTHDMSTIRGWWEEDRALTQQFYHEELAQTGTAPFYCEPWINRAILLQHLQSPSMWSIFQIQDILGMSEKLRRENPKDERINVPANPQHYWCYRMHITLEQLLKEKEFNAELKGYVKNSGR